MNTRKRWGKKREGTVKRREGDGVGNEAKNEVRGGRGRNGVMSG